MPKQNFKFYAHSNIFFQYQDKAGKLSWRKVLRRLPVFIKDVLVGVCYKIGMPFYIVASKIINSVRWEVSTSISSMGARLQIAKRRTFAKSLIIFLCAAAACYAGIATFGLLARALDLKNQLFGVGQRGSQALLEAKTDLQNKDFSGAQSKFEEAYASFVGGKQQLEQENSALNDLLNVLPQKKDSDRVFAAAALLSSAGGKVTQAYGKISSWNISQEGLESAGTSTVSLSQTFGLVQNALAQVDEAGADLSEVNPALLPSSLRDKLSAVQDNFSSLEQAFHSLNDILSLAVGFAGGDKHILVLMENNNELRPTGGFIGTYGYIKIHEGTVSSLNVSSIYDLDGQLNQKIRPPFPLFAVNDHWYLRDSNWFADFPTTAKKVSDFYEAEGGETPDGVIALTPSLIQDLLALTGPIALPRYNVTLTPDNFVELTQVESSVYYNKIDNKPKQILADLVPVLLSRLGSLPKDQFPKLLQILQDSLNHKQMVLYLRDQTGEQQINAFNWGGAIKDTDRDYLNIVSANLNGSKTDLFMRQSINLKTVIDDKGVVTDQLTLTRQNTMPNLPDTSNTSFLRVFVPQGSELLSNNGFDYNTTTVPSLDGYKIDPDVQAWEDTVVTDLTTGTSIGQETGKTFFGNWLTVPGGASKTVTLTYRLPFAVSNLDHFSLLLQKQIGILPAAVTYQINFPSRRLLWSNFQPQVNNDSLSFTSQLTQDYLWGAVFQHN